MLGGNYIPGTNPRFMVTVGAIVTFVCLLLYAVPQMQVAGASRKMRDFCERIAGNWWERVTPVQGTALSWITIRALPATSTVVLNGRAFDNQGAEFAKWDSVASCVDAEQGKVFYHWQGYQTAAPQIRYQGFGEITFGVAEGRLDSGDGIFFDARLGPNTFSTKSSRFHRSTDPHEQQTVEEGADKSATAALIQKKLSEF